MIKTKTNPIVIIGMHRSGTTMIAKILEQNGVFMGNKKDRNNESTFFISLNDRILKACNSTWDRPDNIFFRDSFFYDEIETYIKERLNSIEAIEYWGIKSLFKDQFRKYNHPWGWKDPRNTLNLEIWKKIFPNMKVIHIYRHPLDIALSLSERQKRFEADFVRYNSIKNKILKRIDLGNTFRCIDTLEGVKLWKNI